jgi:hypothetical protein
VTPAVLPVLRPVAPDHAWRQSELNDWLRCGRAFGLRYSGVAPRADLDGWAALIGDAAHEAIAQGLRQRKAGVALSPELGAEVATFMAEAFGAAVEKAQTEGATTDPEGIEGALERVDEMAELVAALLADPRLDAIEWRGIEEPFDLAVGGRWFRGTRDTRGVCVRRVEAFASCGAELVALEPGDVVVVDWKTGTEVAVDHCSRSHNVQLGLYRAGLAGHVRTFIGVLRDLERPMRPRDAAGETIPSKIERLNPAWLAGVGLEAGPAAEKSRKRCLDQDGKNVPKWLEEPNPAYVAACSRPRGPVFHEARIDRAVVAQTIADVIDAARLGIYPASGAANGSCRRCAFRATCAHAGA